MVNDYTTLEDERHLNTVKHLLMQAVQGIDSLLTPGKVYNSNEVGEIKHQVSVLHSELKMHGLLPDPPLLDAATQQSIVDALTEWFALTLVEKQTQDRGLRMRIQDRMKLIEGKFKERGLSLFTELSLFVELDRLTTEEDEEREAEEGV